MLEEWRRAKLYSTCGIMQHHKYSLTEIENMIPYERDIYSTMLENYIKDENDRIKREQNR